MSKIFVTLASVSLILFFVTMGLGLRVGNYSELYSELVSMQQQFVKQRSVMTSAEAAARQADLESRFKELEVPQSRARTHIYSGILASLVGLLVNSISVTYFIGTSRWCKEVVDTYGLDQGLSSVSIRLKRRCFPFALAGMLLILTISAFGAASDPGTLLKNTSQWVLPHFFLALVGTALLAILFWFQADLIERNTQAVDRILAEVHRIRHERGLDLER